MADPQSFLGVASGVLGGDESKGGVLSRLGYLPSNRTVLVVAVVYIGVQGKILFALRGLLLKKVGKPLTRPSAPNWSLCSPRFGADSSPYPLPQDAYPC